MLDLAMLPRQPMPTHTALMPLMPVTPATPSQLRAALTLMSAVTEAARLMRRQVMGMTMKTTPRQTRIPATSCRIATAIPMEGIEHALQNH
jgi:hypothetical protein